VRWSARIFSWSENGGKTILALFEWWYAVICGKKPTICTLTLWWYSHSIVYALLLANNCEVMFISSASLGWQSKSQGRVWMIASPADHFQSATFCANISGKVKKNRSWAAWGINDESSYTVWRASNHCVDKISQQMPIMAKKPVKFDHAIVYQIVGGYSAKANGKNFFINTYTFALL